MVPPPDDAAVEAVLERLLRQLAKTWAEDECQMLQAEAWRGHQASNGPLPSPQWRKASGTRPGIFHFPEPRPFSRKSCLSSGFVVRRDQMLRAEPRSTSHHSLHLVTHANKRFHTARPLWRFSNIYSACL
jgi:hypothetical protein